MEVIPEFLLNPDALRQIYVPSGQGAPVPLSTFRASRALEYPPCRLLTKVNFRQSRCHSTWRLEFRWARPSMRFITPNAKIGFTCKRSGRFPRDSSGIPGFARQ